MHTIPIKVAGDIWCNPQEVRDDLAAVPVDQAVQIDMRMEGPSLGALGIAQELHNHCDRVGRNRSSIILHRAPNTVENIGFRNTHVGHSHFFARSAAYWPGRIMADSSALRMAMFVGRATVARCAIMHDLYHRYAPGSWLFSTMRHDGTPFWEPYKPWHMLENFNDWASAEQQSQIQHWWQEHRPPSLDHMCIEDQYRAEPVTNRSILGHYHRFHIELVCETYTLGDTFFPTEKTVRPIAAAKPWMIYGPPGFIARLRSLGFQSYDQCWDESYDLYQGTARWTLLRDSIDHVYSLDQAQFLAVMRAAEEISAHNQSVLAHLQKLP